MLVHYDMKNHSDVELFDISGNNNDGTFVGEPDFRNCGKYGACIKFSTSRYALVKTDIHKVIQTTPFSISLFVRFDETQNQWSDVFGCHEDINGQHYGIAMQNQGTNNFAVLYSQAGRTWKGWDDDKTFIQYQPLKFYHIVFVLGADNKTKLYVDNELKFNYPQDTSLYKPSQCKFMLGSGHPSVITNQFNGYIADFRVYSGELNHEQINEIYLNKGQQVYNTNTKLDQIQQLQEQIKELKSEIDNQNKIINATNVFKENSVVQNSINQQHQEQINTLKQEIGALKNKEMSQTEQNQYLKTLVGIISTIAAMTIIICLRREKQHHHPNDK